MKTERRLELLEEAKELIIQAQDMVDEAVSGTPIEGNYLAYGRYGFDTLLNKGNPYDNGLDTLIEEIEQE